jgi:hypothetical protein
MCLRRRESSGGFDLLLKGSQDIPIGHPVGVVQIRLRELTASQQLGDAIDLEIAHDMAVA